MTDMRATERLLEVIEELANDTYVRLGPEIDARAQSNAHEIIHAISELRRRGDTLVRADDLRMLMQAVADPSYPNGDNGPWDHAFARLENALGGKML